jgi:hypothetical protein
MKNIIITLLSLNICLLASCDAQVLKTPKAQVLVEIAEEDGTPVSAAKVALVASLSTVGGDRRKDGFTGTDGRISLAVGSVDGQVKGAASKRGYYTTDTAWISLQSGGTDQFKPLKEGKWGENGRLLKIPLRPIKNPVPMYVKDVMIAMKADRENYAYDLEVGDLVAPDGAGRHADLIFSKNISWESYKNYTGTVYLSVLDVGAGIQHHDIDSGLQYCQFKSPYEAPLDGYVNNWRWQVSRKTEEGQTSVIANDDNLNRMFIFRIRPEIDEYGRVIKALHGKIYGPFTVIAKPNGAALLKFAYYLNPDYTRNLEFDPKKNLFPRNPGKHYPEYSP